jgi:hypothetical protein
MATRVKVVQRRMQQVPLRKVTVKELRARLKPYEKKYGLTSEEFYDRFRRGQIEDTKETVDWCLDYQFYLLVKGEWKVEETSTREF